MPRTNLSRPAAVRRRARRAFSLIEVMCGLVLALACAFISAAAMPTAQASREQADLTNKATSLAQKQLEAILQRGFPNTFPENLLDRGLIDSTTPVETNTYSFTNVDLGERDNPATVLPGGTGRVRLEYSDGARRDIRRVTVTVRYTFRGRSQEVQITTLIGDTQQSS